MTQSRRSTLLAGLAAAAALLLGACSDSGSASAAGGDDPAGHRSLGRADAPVTLVEYASATCGHCAQFHVEVLPRIKAEFIETGVVRYEMREFPLDNSATIGFLMARCQPADKYFDILDAQFGAVHRLMEQMRTGSVQISSWFDFYKDFAASIGVDETTFRGCLSNQQAIAHMNATVEHGATVDKVTGTPAFYIDGTQFRATSADSDEIYNQLAQALRARAPAPAAAGTPAG